MNPENPQFFKQDLLDFLNLLKPDQKPEWGLLTPQAMVEHLISSWRISNGRAAVQQQTTQAEAEKYRDFLYRDEPMPPHTKNPVMPADAPPALRKPDLQAAIEQLRDEIETFFNHFHQNPDATPVHPLFGPLSYDEWRQFQSKHIKHHLRQFNLIKDETARLSG